MKRILTLLMPLFVLTACACATVRGQINDEAEGDVRAMMATVVQIHVQLALTAVVADQEFPLDPLGWTGSGVIYDRSGGIVSPPHSMVLTANHVLETPAVGYTEEFPLGVIRVDAVLITVTSADGKTCELETRTLGVNDHRDVAIGEAMCDLGPSAKIASSVPPMGAKLFIVGHPLGFPNTMVTEGYFSGWWNNYMVSSAPIVGGNSGGPVFYNGEVVGLAVRGTNAYHNLSIIAPLGQILERINHPGS